MFAQLLPPNVKPIIVTAAGKRPQSNYSRKNARRDQALWMLATSLNISNKNGAKVVAIYSQKMQIEEAFRDHKSSQYGMGLETKQTGNRSTARNLRDVVDLILVQ